MPVGNRRKGRELALKILYSLPDHQGEDIGQILSEFWRNFSFQDTVLGEADDEGTGEPSLVVRRFAENLVMGVMDKQESIDRLLQENSLNWSLNRMVRVDLALLRMAVFELAFCPDIASNVVINEAIEIGKRFGTAETPAFVNGILDRIARVLRESGPKEQAGD
ncbi:MAG: transcription antitermination factor NusB [Deltaproteobacteria bacterium]|jgi:N utilization substance protein B|nr:transcription antitermination factor NusB [Deltaproteobacteria bacterium]